MRISEHFKLNRSQPYLDFVDVPTHTDLAVFLTPSSIKSLKSNWAHECKSLIQHYFELVLRNIKDGDHNRARFLLGCLNEQNEFHLGFSTGRSQGRAFGRMSAASVWDALANSQASKTGLLSDLEDTCLFIEGIGVDMISDALCNILRGPLIRYTQDMCVYYGIPMTPDMASGPIWNTTTESWDQELIELPECVTGPVILVPKIFVRHKLCYQHEEYYRHYLLPEMQKDEIAAATSLVDFLADGTPRVTKTALMEKYGADKIASTNQTIPRAQILADYKSSKDKSPPPPLAHEQLAEIEGTAPPDWDLLLDELHAVAPGRDDATAYENVIEKVLSSVFYPALCWPEKQYDIHDRRKRVDITYSNEATNGFFYWLALNYPCAQIFVECKNYGREIGNPELDQLSGRFSPGRGRVGLMVCRSLEDETLFEKRCIDTAKDDRGWILSITDADLTNLVLAAKEDIESRASFPLLREKFLRLTR